MTLLTNNTTVNRWRYLAASFGAIGINYGMALYPLVPSLEGLEIFVAVVELGSLSKAASLYGISQPSASERLVTLERVLKLTLLDRTSHGSTATKSGLVIYEQAKKVLAAAEALMLSAIEVSGSQAQRLRVSASYSIAEYLLPQWLDKLRLVDLGVMPELTVLNSARVVESVLASGDLGFIESSSDHSDLERIAVGEDELWIVVAPQHGWARLTRPLLPVEVSRGPLILRERGSGTREIFEEAMARLGLADLNVKAEMGSTAMIKSALAYSASAGVLSRLAVIQEVERSELVHIDVEGLDLRRSLYAIWSKKRGISPIERELLLIAIRGG